MIWMCLYAFFFGISAVSLSLIPTRHLGRVLPNGKKYAEFINIALVVSAFHVRDVITRHASGPQEDSDTETDDEY
jgi:hypothetical protein